MSNYLKAEVYSKCFHLSLFGQLLEKQACFGNLCCTNDPEKVEMGSRSTSAVLSARLVEEGLIDFCQFNIGSNVEKTQCYLQKSQISHDFQ